MSREGRSDPWLGRGLLPIVPVSGHAAHRSISATFSVPQIGENRQTACLVRFSNPHEREVVNAEIGPKRRSRKFGRISLKSEVER